MLVIVVVFGNVCYVQSNYVKQAISDEVLLTVMTEVERSINARPIVPVVSDDINPTALSPNDVLLLRSNGAAELKECILDRYKCRWKQANDMAGVFWKRWTKRYIITLSLCQRWLLYLYSAKQCIIRQTEYEGIENTSYDATCCIRIIHTISVYTITNAFKQYKVYSHKSVMNITSPTR